MQVVLVMFRPDGSRRSFSLAKDLTVIGRGEDCDFRIPLGEVSRKHARLAKDGDTLHLEDLGSSNGTYVNGQRIQEAVLQGGDILSIGPLAFVVQLDGVPADEDIVPPEQPAQQPPAAAEEQSPTPTEEEQPADEAEVDLEAIADDGGHAPPTPPPPPLPPGVKQFQPAPVEAESETPAAPEEAIADSAEEQPIDAEFLEIVDDTAQPPPESDDIQIIDDTAEQDDNRSR